MSGMSTNRWPNATRWWATYWASVTARRIIPADRTPLDRRLLLIMSAIWRKPDPGSPTSHAVAPSRETSPLAMSLVPSFSFRRTMRYRFGVPSGSSRGRRNSDTPAMPSGPPGMRARTMARSASAFEQNHFSPRSANEPPSCGSATTAVAPTSDPAPCSVMNIAPWSSSPVSWEVSPDRYRSTSAGEPNLRSVLVRLSVIDTGHSRPNSAWAKR